MDPSFKDDPALIEEDEDEDETSTDEDTDADSERPLTD